jgi:hypothetical protein
MTNIRQRRDRHFIDEDGRLFWINGPDDIATSPSNASGGPS